MSLEEQQIRFCGRFSPEMSWAALLPGGAEFPYSLPAAQALLTYFRGEGLLLGPAELEHVVRHFFPDLPYLSEGQGAEPPEGKGIQVDLLWNLRRREPVQPDLYRLLSPRYGVSADGLLPQANIRVRIRPDRDELRFRDALLTTFNVPVPRFRPQVRERDRVWVQRLLRSRGYGGRSVLLFVEAELPVDHRFREQASRALGRPVFLVTKSAGGDVLYPHFGFAETLAMLSLADLYIGGGPFFLGFAQLLGIPVLLTRSPEVIPSPESPVWGPFRDPLKGLAALQR